MTRDEERLFFFRVLKLNSVADLMRFSLLYDYADCFGMEGGGNGGGYMPSLSIHSQSHCLSSPIRVSPRSPVGSTAGSESGERYSRKVFVGGLPPDIDEGNPS